MRICQSEKNKGQPDIRKINLLCHFRLVEKRATGYSQARKGLVLFEWRTEADRPY